MRGRVRGRSPRLMVSASPFSCEETLPVTSQVANRFETASVEAPDGGEGSGVDAEVDRLQGPEEWLWAVAGAVGGSDFDVDVGCAGSASVAAGKELSSGGDRLAFLDVDGGAVAVGPVGAVDVLDGDADPAGVAAGRVAYRTLGPTS